MRKRMTIILIVVITLVGCGWVCGGWFLRDSSFDTERKLTAALQALPTPPGARLLAQESWYDGGVGTMPQCAAQVLDVLHGTSQSSLTEIFDYYAAVLPPLGWSASIATGRGRSFKLGQEEYSLAVMNSNDPAGRIGRSTQTAAEAEFKTVYLIEMSRPFRLPYPAECRQW